MSNYANQFDEYVRLQKQNGNKTQIFDIGLRGRTIFMRNGLKGKKLGSSDIKRNTAKEARVTFHAKLETKLKNKYVVVNKYSKPKPTSSSDIFDEALRDLNASLVPVSARNQYMSPNRLQPIPQSSPQRYRSQSSMKNGFQHGNVNGIKHKFKFGQNRSQPQLGNSNYAISPDVKDHTLQRHMDGQRLKAKHLRHLDGDSSSRHSGSTRSSGRIRKHKKKNIHPPKKAKKHHNYNRVRKKRKRSGSSVNGSEYSDMTNERYDHVMNGFKAKQKQRKTKQSESTENEEVDEEEEEEEDVEEDDHDKSGSESDTARSSSSGRSSDDDYEMDYEKMSKIMIKAVNKALPEDVEQLEWKPIEKWIRFDETQDSKAEFAFADMDCRIAGSCHELLVIYIRSPNIKDGQIYTRLLKLARDPDEDNPHHFASERKVCQYLSRIASTINACYNSRTQVCVWPVETIYFSYKDEMKWATVQVPFLPHGNDVFVKVEPNSGPPCVLDPIVGRYQHVFSAMTRGLNLVRDWQGYGVKSDVFYNECKRHICPEATKQIRKYDNDHMNRNTKILVMIDPVLTTCDAHYETNNPTDFGVKAMDEWKETHDCNRCRCSYFYLNDSILFGLADPDEKFLNDKAPQWLIKQFNKCRQDLDIYNPSQYDYVWEPPNDDHDNKDQE